MKQFNTVFQFHLKEGLRSKMFIIMSIVLFLIILGFFGLTHFLNDDSRLNVHLINNSNMPIDEKLINQMQKEMKLSTDPGEKEQTLKKQVEDGKIDGLLVVQDQAGIPQVKYYIKRNPDYVVLSIMEPYLQNQYIADTIQKNNLDADLAKQMSTKVQVSPAPLKSTESTGLVYFFILIMYIFIITFGQTVAMGISGEKTSRVMEIMITKVKPIIMMYAKILANLIQGVLQIFIVFVAYMAAKQLGWAGEDLSLFGLPIDVSVLTVKMFTFFLLYFILGYTLYAFLFASFSSVISRLEDIGSVIFPISLLMLGSFFLGTRAMMHPNDTIVVAGSYIPFFSPVVTFSRFVLKETSVMEVIITIALLVASILIISLYSSRLYIKGVMKYDGKASLKDVFQLMK
ncbi:ABC transporter permease [Peribacillus sp. SCS-155]|uniref:ABC transporter permease n=1 Tax=Peribacillus sedimenti TaxID=3115297 RepID=UPI0039060865